jgi:hypothetical protein
MVKARLITYSEIENRFVELLAELERRPIDEESILENGAQLAFALNVCVGQMKAPDSASYELKSEPLSALEKAQAAITYKINTCTVEEISSQIAAAFKAFGTQ